MGTNGMVNDGDPRPFRRVCQQSTRLVLTGREDRGEVRTSPIATCGGRSRRRLDPRVSMTSMKGTLGSLAAAAGFADDDFRSEFRQILPC
jgi:hypothetical protein